ncbi:hypothetical protein ACIGCP_12395 [Cellulophaga baltica]|uniref:hypothetical protein n=1 Tax=Cellulophaga baltica TaxID=76594 RepID=UPI0037C621B6
MKQLTISVVMGLLCVTTWILAAPVLTTSKVDVEKEKSTTENNNLASRAQTLTML